MARVAPEKHTYNACHIFFLYGLKILCTEVFLMELSIIDKKLAMDSRDIAKLTFKQHKSVLRDIEKMLPKVIGTKVCRLEYKDSRGRIQPYYCLPHRELLILLTGYSVELRTAVIDRWAYLERYYKTERKKSIEVRNTFTDELKDRGYTQQHEFIQTTTQMKRKLGISHKKNEMTAEELKAVYASEALSSYLLTNEYGYHSVNPVCLEASDIVINAKKKYCLKE